MIKQLMQHIREYKLPTLLTPLFMVGEVVCECVIPLLTANLINSVQAGSNMADISKIGFLLLAMAIASMGFGILSGWMAAKAAAGFAKNLRRDLFYRVQDFAFSNIDGFSSASLVTRLTTDVSNVQNAFMMIIRVAVRAPMMLIFAVVMSIQVGKSLSWVFAGVIPMLGFGLFFMATKAMPLFRSAFKKYDRLNNTVQENVQGIRVVKSFVREDYEKQKFSAASEDVKNVFLKAEKILAFNSPLMQLCMYASMILISFFASKIIISTGAAEMGVGSLTSMITYSMQILMSLMMLSMIFVMITMSSASAKRIVEVLNEQVVLTDPLDPITEVKDGSIDFENVSFRYSSKAEHPVLSNIDLHIRSGMTVGILGGTGSSKTSLVQLIPRLYDVTEGCVKVGGIDVRRYALRPLRDSVSMVLQKNMLFSGTIADNLRWGDANASDEEIQRVCKLAQADEFIRQFPDGYNTHIEQGGTNVSGGQKQRLCIARALLKKPKILILDDSTSAVDTKTDAKLRAAFRAEIPDTTKLIIAQRISSIQDADLILVLDNGTISACGTHDELMKSSDIYRDVYTSQNGGAQNA